MWYYLVREPNRIMQIEIICPLYNCSNYIIGLHSSLKKQVISCEVKTTYILTESEDDSEMILNENGIDYCLVKKESFSHSLTRENAARKSTADIICFITQDVRIEDEYWLYKLVKPIIEGEADASYSRQISLYNNIEKYTRKYNYGEKSFIKTKDSISKLGLNTFFYSDSASAINHDVFKKLNYYDGKRFSTNEDMYIAYKLIMNGYRIKYCADSVVYHSHQLSLKETYNRYKKFGGFFKENNYFDNFGENRSGFMLAKYVIKEAMKEKDIKTILIFPFDMIARFIGMKAGKNA